jgi:hypothetical protein
VNAESRWGRIKRIFAEALERPAPERQVWLAMVYGNDDLYSEVRALLEAHEGDPQFLEQGVEVDPEDLAALDGDIAPALPPGTILGDGRYRIIGEAGRGGMAVVYVAEDLRLPRRVAMKALPSPALRDPARLERFRREAWAAARISHPAVATIYAFEQFDGQPFIVYELVRGRTLRAELAQGALVPETARRIAIEIARAMTAAHAEGVVHRDLKPENVMLADGGVVKVLDFGIAQLELEDSASLTREGGWVGTPAYMAPEQRAGGAVDGRADIFSLGAMLTEMLSGQHPTAPAGRGRQRPPGEPGSHPAAAQPGPSGPLQRIAARCLQHDPAARYASARELLEDLEAASAGEVPAGGTARWWWEFHQVATSVVCGLAAVAAWEAWDEVHGVFTDRTFGGRVGTSFVVLIVAAALVSSILRLNLWFTSRHLPGQLSEVRTRRRAWIRGADWALQLALVSGGLLILDASPRRSVLLLAVAVGMAVAGAFIEPVTERAAFGDARSASG